MLHLAQLQAAPSAPAQAQRSTAAAKPGTGSQQPTPAARTAPPAKGAKVEAAAAAKTNARVAAASQAQFPEDAGWMEPGDNADGSQQQQQQQQLQLPAGMSIPGAPPACTADVVRGMSWGVATAAYQIEGAYNVNKGPSIWDTFVDMPGKIKGGGTGKVAIEHYTRFPADYKLMQQMGVNVHRFSFSWPRIVAGGQGSAVNEAGIAFYHKLIDEMVANGITPVATMYHWDLPQVLQDRYGGWLNEQVVKDFAFYADTLFARFGSKIKYWVTINEPASICDHGYKNGIYAPGVKADRSSLYKCGHNVLLAHAAAVKVYRDKYRSQGAKIGFSTNLVWAEPLTDKPEDKQAAQNKLDREFGWIVDPLFTGRYPASMRGALGDELPKFTEEQKALLKGSIDFIGINIYTARWVWHNSDKPFGWRESSRKDGVPIGDQGGATWLYNAPFAMGNVLRYVGEKYNKAETWITEFGTGITGENTWTGSQVLNDSYRTNFYSGYINSACKSINTYKLNVPMIFAWSLWDNFEWAEGYEVRYGMVHVDFASQERKIKQSGYWWSKHFFTQGKKLAR
uniref:Beta-glucosidase n=1 Tax=Tetradesmus obliquus TaxID=3088 RepID=A0A383WBJ0_TETOB